MFLLPLAAVLTGLSTPLDQCESRGLIVYAIAARRDAGVSLADADISIAKAAVKAKLNYPNLAWLLVRMKMVYEHPDISPLRLESGEVRACYSEVWV